MMKYFLSTAVILAMTGAAPMAFAQDAVVGSESHHAETHDAVHDDGNGGTVVTHDETDQHQASSTTDPVADPVVPVTSSDSSISTTTTGTVGSEVHSSTDQSSTTSTTAHDAQENND